jgi:uncharacterized membrane protein
VWPVAVHASVLLGAAEWAPRVTAAAAVLAVFLWAATLRTAGAFASGALLAVIVAGSVAGAPNLLLYAPPVAINLALAAVFGASLCAGHTPVISRFARMEQGDLPPDLASYTRALTWIWTVLFVAMACSATALAFFAPLEAWSVFANVVSYLLVAALFIGEYAYRRWRFRHYHHATLIELMHNVWCAGLRQRRPGER